MVPVLHSERYRRALIVLVAILAVFAVGGCVWGVFIPTTTATVDSGYLSTDPTQDGREFTGFVALVAGLFVLSMAGALAAWGWAPRSRGPVMLWLLAIVAMLGGIIFIDVGNAVASSLHPLPDVNDVRSGQTITWAPHITAGAALAGPPLLASLTYWCAAVVGKGDFPDELPSLERHSRTVD